MSLKVVSDLQVGLQKINDHVTALFHLRPSSKVSVYYFLAVASYFYDRIAQFYFKQDFATFVETLY